MMTDTWLTEDLPFLQAVRELEDALPAGSQISVEERLDRFGPDLQKAYKVAIRLARSDYIDGSAAETMAGIGGYWVAGLTEKGRRAVGQWPSVDPWDNLVDLLSAQIQEEEDPVKKGKLEALRDSVLVAGRSIGTTLVTELMKKQMGL